MKLDHIALNAVNLEDEIEFFTSFLGFDLLQQWDAPRQAYVGLESGPVIGIIENEKFDGTVYTMAHLALDVPEKHFDSWVRRVESAKLTIVAGPKEQRGGRTILFRSPGSNIIELCYPSARESIKNQAY